MRFGNPFKFAIECYHEPSGPEGRGFGRMCIFFQGECIGDIKEGHCSLFHATERLREIGESLDCLWNEKFGSLTDTKIFHLLNRALFLADDGYQTDLQRFDFLTNVGEQFIISKLLSSVVMESLLLCFSRIEMPPFDPYLAMQKILGLM